MKIHPSDVIRACAILAALYAAMYLAVWLAVVAGRALGIV
jgi:hypothetical protein